MIPKALNEHKLTRANIALTPGSDEHKKTKQEFRLRRDDVLQYL